MKVMPNLMEADAGGHFSDSAVLALCYSFSAFFSLFIKCIVFPFQFLSSQERDIHGLGFDVGCVVMGWK